MELHKFHITQFTTGSKCHGMPVGGGDFRVRGFAIEPASPPRGENRLLGPDKRLAMTRIPDESSTTFPLVRQQIERKGVFPNINLRHTAYPFDQGPHHLFSCGIPQGMNHTAMTVPPFLSQRDFTIGLIK